MESVRIGLRTSTKVSREPTVDAVKSELVDQGAGGAYECLDAGWVPSHAGEVLTPLPASPDGKDDLHLRVLLFHLRKRPEAALRAVYRHLCVGPLIAQLAESA